MSANQCYTGVTERFARFSHEGKEYRVSHRGLECVASPRESSASEWKAEGTATHADLEGVARDRSKLRVFQIWDAAGSPLTVDRPLLVGRSKVCDVILDNHTVSRFHAVFLPNNVSVRVVDLDSQNGTRVGALHVRDTELWATTHLFLGAARIVLRPFAAEPAMIALPSEAMAEVYRLTDSFARSDAPVVVLGESGVGKESLVQRIHAA